MQRTEDSAEHDGRAVVLWTGERHSGKTTSAGNLARAVRGEGFEVAGLLARSVYHDGKLIGFDAVDLSSGAEAPLARYGDGVGDVGRFAFLDEGLRLGQAALSGPGVESADLVIIDEFGPLELDGKGWRKNVDSLLEMRRAVILLVVRRELAGRIERLYAPLCGAPWADFGVEVLDAVQSQSMYKVVRILKDRRGARGEVT